ncbi:glycoside hydrolase family protein [Paenibacillus chitinolyticus]|uniref:glycoside hydrolase family protein n=1 Tax=Paenibacillus chitinolyticus TaxID=79263 RepID=UPI003555E658
MFSFKPAPVGGGFRMEGYWVWCGSAVKGEDGRYHLFASRWPDSLPMHPGWLVSSEVVRAVSDTPEGPYTYAETVLPARGAEYWDGRSTHNPHIVRIGDTYVLYYMGSTHPFADPEPGEPLRPEDPVTVVARSNKRIGIATASRPEGPWLRRDEPVLTVRPGMFDSFLTSNPAPCVLEDGSVLLVYKARKYEGFRHGEMTIGAAKASHFEGPYTRLAEGPLFPPDFNIEDPFVWKTEDGFSMIAKDMTGRLCGEKYGGIRAFSPDGVTWSLCDPPKAYSRTFLWDDGVMRQAGNLERPFLLMEGGVPTHLFAAASDGTKGFHDCTKTWNMVIPLKEGPPTC